MSKLPNGWVAATLGELLSAIVGGGTPSKSNADSFRGSIPFMTVKDMHERFISDTQDHITEEALENSASTLIPADTLVVASRMSLGKIARPKIPVAINQDLKALFPHVVLDKTYIEYAWRANESKIQAMGTGTTVKGIRLEDIRSLDIPLAPRTEQSRITDQLEKLLTRIEACNHRINAIPALLKRFRRAVLAAAVTGKITSEWRSTNDELRFPWPEVRISDAGQVQLGRQRAPKYHSGDYMRPYLRVQNVFEDRLDLSDVMEMDFSPDEFERYQLHPGDILLNEGQSPAYLGRPAIYRGELPGACFTNTLIRFKSYPHVMPEFALSVFRHHMHSGRYVREGKITTNIAHLGAGRFANVEFPLPTLEEQAEIVRRVEALLKLSDRIEAHCKAARSQAQRLTPLLLAKAFRGELVQQDSQDEPASVLLERIAATKPAQARTSHERPRIQKRRTAVPELDPIDCASLPKGAWAAPADPDGQAAVVWLTAVLRAWDEPMPEREARLAVMFCQQPRLFAAVLPATQATQWSHLVGDEAKPLPTQVLSFRPAINGHWARAIKGMKARDDLVEAGLGDGITWALGLSAASIETAGWPDGRAGFVVAYLRAHGIASVLPLLEPSAQEFVDARAA